MTWKIFSRQQPAPEAGVVAEPAPAPRISEQDAKAMVDSLVSAATGAAMLDLPPTIYLAMAQNLAREKAKVAAALMTPNVFYPDPASSGENHVPPDNPKP